MYSVPQKLSKLWNNFPFHLTVKLRFFSPLFLHSYFLHVRTDKVGYLTQKGPRLKILTIVWQNFWRIIFTYLLKLMYFYDKYLKIIFILFIGSLKKKQFSNFSYIFLNPNISNCSNLLDLRNLMEQVKQNSVTNNCSDLSLFE